MHILLIEDEFRVADFLRKGLKESGYDVTVAYDGLTGLSLALEKDFDLIILDIILPNMSGTDVCAQIRKMRADTPVLLLTALATIEDKIRGFKSGSDDYLTKPFHFEELLVRIKALTRRSSMTMPTMQYTAGDLVMDCYKKLVKRGALEIVLTAKEYNLLEYLLVNKNRVVSRSQIADAVWGIGFQRGTNLIDVYVNYLRAKVDKGFEKKYIHTVVGMGYVLKGD